MVSLINDVAGWGILVAWFTFVVSTLNSLLDTFVDSLGGSNSIHILSMLLLVVVSLKSFYSRNNYSTYDYFRWCGIVFGCIS